MINTFWQYRIMFLHCFNCSK